MNKTHERLRDTRANGGIRVGPWAPPLQKGLFLMHVLCWKRTLVWYFSRILKMLQLRGNEVKGKGKQSGNDWKM